MNHGEFAGGVDHGAVGEAGGVVIVEVHAAGERGYGAVGGRPVSQRDGVVFTAAAARPDAHDYVLYDFRKFKYGVFT